MATPGCVLATRSLLNWPVVGPLTLPLFGVDQTFHIDGYVWAPGRGDLRSTYATANGQAFNWGMLVRSFQMLGLTCSPMTLAGVPAAQPGSGDDLHLLGALRERLDVRGVGEPVPADRPARRPDQAAADRRDLEGAELE